MKEINVRFLFVQGMEVVNVADMAAANVAKEAEVAVTAIEREAAAADTGNILKLLLIKIR